MKIAMVLLDDFDNNVLGRSFDKIVVRKNTITVFNDGKVGLYNSSDFSLILECVWDSILESTFGVVALAQTKSAFYSYTGQCILKCEWDKIKVTNEGLIVFNDGKQGFYSFDGKCIFDCVYKRVESYASAILAFKDKKRYVYNIKKGKFE